MSYRQDAKANQGERLLHQSLQRIHNLSQGSEEVKYLLHCYNCEHGTINIKEY